MYRILSNYPLLCDFFGQKISPFGRPVLDHLAADGASLTGGQVAVGQVDTDLLGSLHLELVHCLTSLGNIDLVAVLHNDTPLSVLTESSAATIALPKTRRKHIDFFEKSENFGNLNDLDAQRADWLQKPYSFICIGYLSAL